MIPNTSMGAMLERQFIVEMLRASGVERSLMTYSDSGGVSEFASFVTDQYADNLMQRGGLGLTVPILRSLARSSA